jgi:ribosomal subunit interface protein
MQISISGNIDTGSSLQQYVEEKLTKQVKKHFDSAVSAHVHFKKQNQKQNGNHPIHHVTIAINEGSKRHVEVTSDAKGSDIHVTFDMALHKVITQLRKHKDKMLTEHRHKKEDKI